MKFKAHIKLTKEQCVVRNTGYGDPPSIYFEFSLISLIQEIEWYYQNQVNGYDKDVIDILVPWLMEGNEPEIVELDPKSLQTYFKDIGRQLINAGGGVMNFPMGTKKKGWVKAKAVTLFPGE